MEKLGILFLKGCGNYVILDEDGDLKSSEFAGFQSVGTLLLSERRGLLEVSLISLAVSQLLITT